MKKLLSSILTAVLLLGTSLNVFAATPNLFQGANEIIATEFSQMGISTYSLSNQENEDIIIHNNGNAIESDYFAEGQNEGNYLVAVKYKNTEYGIVETAYFANVESISTDELVEMVSESTTANFAELVPVTARSADEPILKEYNWSFYSNSILQATLTTSVTLTRQTSNATLNGKACSVWDVTTFSQLEKKKCIRLNDQYTRLSVDLSNQSLVSYGPTVSTSGGDVSVGLDGAGIPSVSYSFNIDGFSIEDLSSMSNDYGRWAFIDHVGNEPHFTTEPAIRATNTSGNFIVELSHTMNANASTGSVIDQGTGVIQIYCADR